MNYCDRNNDVAIGITNIHIAANLLSRTEIPPIKKKKRTEIPLNKYLEGRMFQYHATITWQIDIIFIIHAN